MGLDILFFDENNQKIDDAYVGLRIFSQHNKPGLVHLYNLLPLIGWNNLTRVTVEKYKEEIRQKLILNDFGVFVNSIDNELSRFPKTQQMAIWW